MANDNNLQETGIMKPDPFWGDNFSILFRQDRLVEFVPSVDMNTNERLNSIARFGIYAGLLLTMYYGNLIPIYGSIFVLGTTLFLHKNQNNFLGEMINQEPFDGTSIDLVREKRLEDLGIESSIGMDEVGNLCTKPTDNNPFMNILVPEYHEHSAKRPEACSVEDPEIQKDMNDKFQINLYRDVGDLFEKNNGQRQFYTNPITTIPNDQKGFANWLFGNSASCKSDRYDCHGDFNDPRRKRFIFPDPTQNPVTSNSV